MRKKSFVMENDVGIEVKYTILGVSPADSKERYVVYTNFMPSDNELGYRLMAGKLVSEDPFLVSKLSTKEQKSIIEDFKIEIIKSGKKIKR